MGNNLYIFVSAHLCYQFLHIVLKQVGLVYKEQDIAQEYSKHKNEYIYTFSSIVSYNLSFYL